MQSELEKVYKKPGSDHMEVGPSEVSPCDLNKNTEYIWLAQDTRKVMLAAKNCVSVPWDCYWYERVEKRK